MIFKNLDYKYPVHLYIDEDIKYLTIPDKEIHVKYVEKNEEVLGSCGEIECTHCPLYKKGPLACTSLQAYLHIFPTIKDHYPELFV